MGDLAVALGLLLALEGAFYAAAPVLAKKMIANALATPENTLRIGGLIALVIGVAIVWIVRG